MRSARCCNVVFIFGRDGRPRPRYPDRSAKWRISRQRVRRTRRRCLRVERDRRPTTQSLGGPRLRNRADTRRTAMDDFGLLTDVIAENGLTADKKVMAVVHKPSLTADALARVAGLFSSGVTDVSDLDKGTPAPLTLRRNPEPNVPRFRFTDSGVRRGTPYIPVANKKINNFIAVLLEVNSYQSVSGKRQNTSL